MRKLWLSLFLASAAFPAGGRQEALDRSPSGLALSPDGRWALTANRTSDTVSLVDLREGRVAAEAGAGRRPFSIAWRGAVAVATNWLSDSITIFEADPPGLAAVATVPVGDEPRGVALAPDGSRAYVALSGENAVAVVDLRARKVSAKIRVGDEPWPLAITPDGKRLAVGNTFSQDVSVVDTATLEVARTVPLKGRNLRHMAVSPDGAWLYVPHIIDRGSSTTLQNIERGQVLINALGRVPLTADAPREAMPLDVSGFAVGDLEGVAVSNDGARIAVAVGGTRSLLLMAFPLPFVAAPREFLDAEFKKDRSRYRRAVGLKGRPLACAFLPDGRSVVVANYLTNRLQIVDWETGDVARQIPLGGPAEPSLARKGEAIFYDAYRSWHEWFSCHTCHTEGHTNGGLYDTFNDGKYGNPKKVLSLRGVAKTGPWTWHGWQGDLRTSVQGSFTRTMAREPANSQDLAAFMAFLETLDFLPPPPSPGDDVVKRGEAVFKAKACDTCHAPPHYTSDEAFLVGLEVPGDAYKGYNPPSLRGAGHRGPWLHDGRAKTLEDLLLQHHRPLKLTGKPDLTPSELADVIAFLKSL